MESAENAPPAPLQEEEEDCFATVPLVETFTNASVEEDDPALVLQSTSKDYFSEDDDYVLLSGPFEHPTEKLQEELLVTQYFQMPSAPPLFAYAEEEEGGMANPYAHLLGSPSVYGDQAGDDCASPQNHTLFQLLAEFYGANLKSEATRTRIQSLQDKVQRLSQIAWEKKTNILLLEKPAAGKQQRSIVTVPYTGQTLSLPKKIYNNLFPHQQPFTEPGTFRVAQLAHEVCKQKQGKQKELLVAVDEAVDAATITSSKRSAVMHYVAGALEQYDEWEWKAICDVLLDHETKQPSDLVEDHLHQVVQAMLLSPSENSGLEHKIWLIRRVKRYGWKRKLNTLLTHVAETSAAAPMEWKRNDWLDRWLVLLQVCCEPVPRSQQQVDIEVLFVLLQIFPFEEGLQRIASIVAEEDEEDCIAVQRRKRQEQCVAQVLRVLTSSCLQFRNIALQFSRELGSRVCLVLERFSALENIDGLVLQCSQVLAMLCNSAQQPPQPMSFLARISKPTCWKLMAQLLFGETIMEDATKPLPESTEEMRSNTTYYVLEKRSADAATVTLLPHNLDEWLHIAPLVRAKLLYHRVSCEVTGVLALLSLVALRQETHCDFAHAVAKELVGLTFVHACIAPHPFATQWLAKLCAKFPLLVDRCLLPLITHNEHVFLPQIHSLESLLHSPQFKWRPETEESIEFLPSWISIVPKWPQASPPRFAVAMALCLCIDTENISPSVVNSFACTLAQAAICIDAKLEEEARISQLLAIQAYSTIMERLWQVLLQLDQVQGKALSPQVLHAQQQHDAVAAASSTVMSPMLAFVVGMQAVDKVLSSLEILITSIPASSSATRPHMLCAARRLSTRLQQFNPVLMKVMRLESTPDSFVNEVVLKRSEDVAFWIKQCTADDYLFANALLFHLPSPFICDWPMFKRFAVNLPKLPRRLRCQVLIARTVLQMPAWFALGAHMYEASAITSTKEVLEMDHKHLSEILSLYGALEVPLVEDFAIFAWADLLLSPHFAPFGFDLATDEDFVVSLSICAQFLSSLQCSTTANGQAEFGNLFFHLNNIQLQFKISDRLKRLSKELHLHALHLSEQCRIGVLQLAEMCLAMANGNGAATITTPDWQVFSEQHPYVDFSRLCMTKFTHVPQTMSVVCAPQQQPALPTPQQVVQHGSVVGALCAAITVPPPSAGQQQQRRRRQLNVMDLLKQSVVAIVETRKRLVELNELEAKQFSQLYAHVPSTVPVHDLALGQVVGKETVTISTPDQDMEASLTNTVLATRQEIESIVARFSPGAYASNELFDCVQEIRQFIDTLEDASEVFKRLFAIEFCGQLIGCKSLASVWLDLCHRALERCAHNPEIALYIVQQVVKQPWRIPLFHDILPMMPTSDLVRAYELVLFPEAERVCLDPLACLLVLERFRRSVVQDENEHVVRALLDVCFRAFRMEGINAKVVDHLRRHVFKPLLPALLHCEYGIVHICRALMNSSTSATPLACVFWEDVSSVDDSVWDSVSGAACVAALEELRPRSSLKDRKMCWNQGFIALAPLLCNHQDVPVEALLRCWEVWILAEEDESLLNAFVSLLQHTCAMPENNYHLLAVFYWYNTHKDGLPHLEKKFRKLPWSRLMVHSPQADEFFHALESVHFYEHVLQPNSTNAISSVLFQTVVASASFAPWEFDLQHCKPDFLVNAFRFAVKIASECQANMFLCLPFEHLPPNEVRVDGETSYSEEQLAVMVTVTMRNPAAFAEGFLSSLFADGVVALPPANTFHMLLQAFASQKAWIVPHLVDLLTQHKEILDQFCIATAAVSAASSNLQQTEEEELSLANRILPRFLTSREVVLASSDGGGMTTAVWQRWPCKYDGTSSTGALIRKFLGSEIEACKFACLHALRAKCSRIVNELAVQVDLRHVQDLRLWLEPKSCVQCGSALVLVAAFLQEDALSHSFQYLRLLNYELAGETALVLASAFARELRSDAFSLDLAEEIARIMVRESKLASEHASLCTALAVFGDMLHMYVSQERGLPFTFLSTFKRCGWTCSRLDWLHRGEFAVIDKHSLPWILDQIRFTLFPSSKTSATQLPLWHAINNNSSSSPQVEGDFLVL